MNRLAIFHFLLLLAVNAFAQKKIVTVHTNDDVVWASVDRVGELYILTSSGAIQKFDVNGKVSAVYKNEPSPTLFEPRDGSRLFAFLQKERRVDYLNPSFEVTKAYVIDSAFVIEPWLACSSGDHQLWILDAADESIKKIDPRTSTLILESPFQQNITADFTNIRSMREYQGFLFFLEVEKGIHIFNGFGKWLKTIPARQLSYFNFLGEELYFPRGNSLVFYNLFSGEERDMPVAKPFRMALVTDERLYLIQSKAIDFFEFKP